MEVVSVLEWVEWGGDIERKIIKGLLIIYLNWSGFAFLASIVVPDSWESVNSVSLSGIFKQETFAVLQKNKQLQTLNTHTKLFPFTFLLQLVSITSKTFIKPPFLFSSDDVRVVFKYKINNTTQNKWRKKCNKPQVSTDKVKPQYSYFWVFFPVLTHKLVQEQNLLDFIIN